MSINVISANEINENNLNSIDSSNQIELDDNQDTNILSSDLSENQIVEELSSDNADSADLSGNSYDSEISSAENNAEDTQSSTNQANTAEDIENNEETDHTIESNIVNTNDEEIITVSDNTEVLDNNVQATKEKSCITIANSTILCGNCVYLYLKDTKGNRLVNKTVTLTINGKTYTKTTNQNGIVYIRLNSFVGTYTLKAQFKGDSKYYANTSSFSVKIYKIKTAITISSSSVVRGKYLYAYLKDGDGKAISGMKMTIKLNGVTYSRTTNANGRIGLTVSPAEGKYSTVINYPGNVSHYACTKTFTLNVVKATTAITVVNTTVIKGKYLYAYLKTSAGVALASKAITITFDGKNFAKTTNAYGRVFLYVNKAVGSYSTKIAFKGDGYNKACSKSFTLKCILESTKIVVQNTSVVRNGYLYAFLKDVNNNPIANEKLEITFGSSKYTRTTNSNGRVGLHITAHVASYSVKVSFAGSNSYKSCSKSFTVKVLTNATAKIIAKSQTCIGEYSIRLTDMKGNPLSGETLKVVATTTNHSAGSGKKITQKTIVIDTDIIYSATTDKKYMNDIASALRAKGYTVIVSERGPNAHNNDIMDKYSNACILCLFGGADSGMFVDMSSKWYQNYLTKNKNRVVLGFLVPPNTVNLATCTYLPRAHDDDYSPSNFTGLSYPGNYLNEHGMDYIYGRNANEMANNFINYAVKGLSIGLNNTLPSISKTVNIKTNSNGYATLTGLPSGNYTLKISYTNPSKGLEADTVTVKVEIL